MRTRQRTDPRPRCRCERGSVGLGPLDKDPHLHYGWELLRLRSSFLQSNKQREKKKGQIPLQSNKRRSKKRKNKLGLKDAVAPTQDLKGRQEHLWQLASLVHP